MHPIKKLSLGTLVTAALIYPLVNAMPTKAAVLDLAEQETNNTFSTANVLLNNNSGFLISGSSTYIPGDPDYFRFSATAGSVWDFILSATNSQGADPEPILAIFDPFGNRVASYVGRTDATIVNNVAFDTASITSFTPTVDGFYGLAVSGLNDINFNGTDRSTPSFGYSITAAPVPEPASILGILAFGAFGGNRLLKRKRQQTSVTAE